MKTLVGFVAGAVVAGGLVWFVVHKNRPAEPQAAVVSTAPVAPAAPAVEAPPAPQAAPVAPPAVPEKRTRPSPAGRPKEPPVPAVTSTKAPEQAPPPSAPPPAPAAAAPEAAPPAAPPAPAAAPVPPPRQPHTVTIAAGTLIPVRLGETLSSDKLKAGDTFMATLDQPLVVDGFVVAERGARAEGKVVTAEQAGRVRGLAQLAIELVRFTTADGQKVAIRTATFAKEGPKSVGSDAAKVGAASAIGAAIGAIAGGGKGAAIGAGVGGAAGAGGVMATRGKPAELPVETRISFRLQEPVTVTEKLR